MKGRSASGGASQQEEPEGGGDGQPDEQERRSDDGGGRLVTVEQEHGEPGVDEEGGGAGEHAVRFGGGVDAAVVFDGEREGGKRHRRRGAEKAGETFGAENGAEEGEAGDEESADEESEEELSEHRGSGYAEDRGTRGEILQQLAHLKVAATKFHGGRTARLTMLASSLLLRQWRLGDWGGDGFVGFGDWRSFPEAGRGHDELDGDLGFAHEAGTDVGDAAEQLLAGDQIFDVNDLLNFGGGGEQQQSAVIVDDHGVGVFRDGALAGVLQADPYRDPRAHAFAAAAILREQVRRGHNGHGTTLQFLWKILKNEEADVPCEISHTRARVSGPVNGLRECAS